MELEFKDNKIKLKKELTNLDLFVKDFIQIIESLKIDYVIISGYISIVFGRSRNTEDIDMILERIDKNKFNQLWQLLEKDFECMNTANMDEAFEYLFSNTPIRFYKKGNFIPNMEIKFKKTTIDCFSLNHKIRVMINNFQFNTSMLELQIVYKLFMGSDKDLEDAKFLYNLFKTYLNQETLKELLGDFGEQTKERFNIIDDKSRY